LQTGFRVVKGTGKKTEEGNWGTGIGELATYNGENLSAEMEEIAWDEKRKKVKF